MARSEAKIKEGAAAFLEPGEEVLAAVVARPRGWTQQSASPGGGVVAGNGRRRHRRQEAEAEHRRRAGVRLRAREPDGPGGHASAPPSLKVTAPVGLGIGMKVEGLVSAVPLSDVDSIEVKRLAAGKTVTLTVRGNPFALEVGAGGNAKGVGEALERARPQADADGPGGFLALPQTLRTASSTGVSPESSSNVMLIVDGSRERRAGRRRHRRAVSSRGDPKTGRRPRGPCPGRP